MFPVTYLLSFDAVRRRAAWWAVLVAALLPAAARPATAADPAPLLVVAYGPVPGFDTPLQLAQHVAQLMREAGVPAGWHLRPAADPDSAGAHGSLVVWEFRALAHAGGSTRYVGPGDRSVQAALFGGHRPFSLETRLYLDGAYQVTLLRQPSLRGGDRDRQLRDTVAAVTRDLITAAASP